MCDRYFTVSGKFKCLICNGNNVVFINTGDTTSEQNVTNYSIGFTLLNRGLKI